MIAIGVSRAEHEAALASLDLPASAHRVLAVLHGMCDWATGICQSGISAWRLAWRTNLSLRTVYAVRRLLAAMHLLGVIDRDADGVPRVGLTLPGRPLRWLPASGDDVHAPAAPGPPPAPPPAKPQTLVGRLYDGVASAIRRAAGAFDAHGHIVDELPLVPRDMRLELLDGTPQARELAFVREQESRPLPEPPPELEEHLRARHVGALYRSREEAARARAQAQGPPRDGDLAPHRQVVLALGEAYRRRGVKWAPSRKDHRLIRRAIARHGLDAALWMCSQVAAGASGLADWVG